nr:SIR2 family protein [uncultured Fusobacterium sp.]
MQDTNINFNLFIAEEFCKLISSPSNQVITKDLFSTTNKDFVVLNNSLALPELTQKFLDDIIYDKKEIVERISKIFSSRSRYNLNFYKKLFENDLFATIISSNYDYVLEDSFSNQIKKNTPFYLSNDESAKKSFYKIYGDFKDREQFIISTQDIKRVKLLGFYTEFWNRLREEFKKRPTIFLGFNMNDKVLLDILDFTLSKIGKGLKEIYIYTNQTSDKILVDNDIASFVKKYSVKFISGENEEFFQTVLKKFNLISEQEEDTKVGDADQNYA